jgi:23S rRNA (pseudouridine1915-N3)-methyltransferase
MLLFSESCITLLSLSFLESMHLSLIHIHPRPNAQLPFEEDVAHYLKLASRWLPSQSRGFASESAFGAFLDASRQRPAVVLCDLRGKAFTSEEFAEWIAQRRDAGAAQMVLGIGPADGWSAQMLKKADLRLSFSAMTLPHALARLVLAEQIYRAATILGGHPYHLGH